MQASVGSQCVECVRSARPPTVERLRRWNAGQTAIMTKAIIAANVLVFVIGLNGGNLLNGEGSVQVDLGLNAIPVRNGEWYRLITSGFTHAGLLHLALNMWFIWIIGQMLERAIGSLRFTLLYFAALLAGSAGALIADPYALTVGASGAAFGLLGAMAVGMRQRGMSVLRSDIGMLLILNLVLTFAIPGIAIGGHIGGLIGGAHLRRRPPRAPPGAAVVGADRAGAGHGGLGRDRRTGPSGTCSERAGAPHRWAAGTSLGRSGAPRRRAAPSPGVASPTRAPVVVDPPAGPVPPRLVPVGLERHAGRLQLDAAAGRTRARETEIGSSGTASGS